MKKEGSKEIREVCPFCEMDGCCFCGYEGLIKIGIGLSFETVEQYEKEVNRLKTGYSYRYLNGQMLNPLTKVKQATNDKS